MTALRCIQRYASFEYSARPDDVRDVMHAVGLLELTWTGANRDNITMTAEAHRLLAGVDARLTSEAKAAWRWRLLLLFLPANAAESAGPAVSSMLIYILMATILFFRPQGLFPPKGAQ